MRVKKRISHIKSPDNSIQRPHGELNLKKIQERSENSLQGMYDKIKELRNINDVPPANNYKAWTYNSLKNAIGEMYYRYGHVYVPWPMIVEYEGYVFTKRKLMYMCNFETPEYKFDVISKCGCRMCIAPDCLWIRKRLKNGKFGGDHRTKKLPCYQSSTMLKNAKPLYL